MKQSVRSRANAGTERRALGRRVKQFYDRFNEADWAACYSLIDPLLTGGGKVDPGEYATGLRAFKSAYGSVTPWMTRLSLHLNATAPQRDPRPFAFVYVVWQDDTHGFHMFRERWVKEKGKWFTRVIGLVPAAKADGAASG